MLTLLLKRLNIKVAFIAILMTALLFITGAYVLAQSDSSQFSQEIGPGTLSTQIRSDSTTEVGSPNVVMADTTFSFNCQNGETASTTGTFASSTERLYVDNPDAADGGWVLSIAAVATTTLWTDGGSNKFDFNDMSGGGCDDSDLDTFGGVLTIDPSGYSVTADYSGSDVSNFTPGSEAYFEADVNNTITLITAAAGAPDIWRGYFTDFAVSQSIPAEQAAASYTIDLIITIGNL